MLGKPSSSPHAWLDAKRMVMDIIKILSMHLVFALLL